ncbi:hypothetical protein JCM10213_005595 [Rhodosporidiobolus nylandii]
MEQTSKPLPRVDALPNELILEVLTYLGAADFFVLQRVSRFFRRLIASSAVNKLWQAEGERYSVPELVSPGASLQRALFLIVVSLRSEDIDPAVAFCVLETGASALHGYAFGPDVDDIRDELDRLLPLAEGAPWSTSFITSPLPTDAEELWKVWQVVQTSRALKKGELAVRL